MKKTFLIATLKFAALTVWIGFVAMFAENLFRPGALDQHRMVEECKLKAGERFKFDVDSWRDHYFRDAGTIEVVLVPASRNQRLVGCLFGHDQQFVSMF